METRMKMKKNFFLSAAAVILAIMAGCSAPEVKQTPPTIGYSADFIADEGAHFELPSEFWYLTGKLDSKEGPYYFASHFHKAGSQFIHTRNGYNSIRTPDGKYDYRSFGQGLVRTLAENYLREKIEKFPGDSRYPEILKNLGKDKSIHFYTMNEEERALYRGRLFIDFGKNHFERTGETKLEYELKLDTWVGPLDLKLEALTDPVVFPAANPIRIGEGNMQGYFFPRVKAAGVSGTIWYNHIFGMPHHSASGREEIITQRLNNGGAFVIACYYNSYGELKNTNVAYIRPDGTLDYKANIKIKQEKTWRSDISRNTYPVSWSIEGGEFSGKITPTFENSEMMLEEGVGAFWLGPCSFRGRIGRNPWKGVVAGEGFCRVVGTEDKPKP